MVEVRKPKPNIIEVWEWKNRNTFVKKVSGKVTGGIVSFTDADPADPVIWLGDASYILENQSSKHTILFYDVITKMLFKPNELGTNMAETGVLPATVKNVIMGANDAKNALGLVDNANNAMKWIWGMVMIVALVSVIFMYLLATHGSGGSAAASAGGALGHPLINVTGGGVGGT